MINWTDSYHCLKSISCLPCVPGVIIITDGVTSVPDVAVCETLLNQLRSGTIACSFVQVKITTPWSYWQNYNVFALIMHMFRCRHHSRVSGIVILHFASRLVVHTPTTAALDTFPTWS